MRVQQWVLTAALVACRRSPPRRPRRRLRPIKQRPAGHDVHHANHDHHRAARHIDQHRRRRPLRRRRPTPTSTTSIRTPGGWFASAFVGSDFGQSADESSVDFGGALGYTSGWFGAEFLAGFTPNFQIRNQFFVDEPQVNSYMFNLMAGVPMGSAKNFQPFVSGGIGALTLRSDDLSGEGQQRFQRELRVGRHAVRREHRVRRHGVCPERGHPRGRALLQGVRRQRARRRPEPRPGTFEDNSPINILPGLDFWRANIGLAFRW